MTRENNNLNEEYSRFKPKGLLFDVDKTLTNTQYMISSRTISSLDKLKDMDIKFGLCTGRSYAMLKNYILTFFPDQSLHVTSGGGEVVSKEGKILWSRYIDVDTVRLIVNKTEELESEFCFSQGDIFFGSKNIVSTYSSHQWKIKTDPLVDHANLEAIPLISIVNLNGESRDFFRNLKGIAVKEMLGANGQFYLDITQESVNKLTGSRVWSGLNGFGIKEVAAFGDSENDVEVIQGVGLGVAMGNAIEEVKQIAKLVIKHTDEDGLSQFIDELIVS